MGSPHRSLDHRAPLVLDTQDLGRHAGGMKQVQTTVDAPDGIGTVVIGVPPGSPVALDLRLESVIEGVLVTGTATVHVRGECVRCLTEISDTLEIDVQELFVHPESEATEEEASRLEDDLVDLEPLLRDGVVLDLPFQPLCREDCQGLCVECGANLNDDPEHSHETAVDPRWEKLRRLEGGDSGSYDVQSQSQS
jgi:uncharacterized protein